MKQHIPSNPVSEKPVRVNSRSHLGKLGQAGLRKSAEEGHHRGPVPLGYRNIRAVEGSCLIPDDSVAPLVQQAFQLAKDGLSIRANLKYITASGLRSRRGNALKPSALWRLLKNPFYKGICCCNGETIKGTHQPLVSEEQFDAVQLELAGEHRWSGLGSPPTE